MSEPRRMDNQTEIENALQEVFHAPSPEAHFVSNLERSLLTRARQESQAPSRRQRFSALFASSARGVAWGVGALLLVLVLVWGIRNLIPVALPAQQETPTPANIVASPEKSLTPGELPAESRTYTNPENGFSFSYPADWTVEEAPHYVYLRKGPLYRLVIAFRRPEESHNIQPTGMPSGEIIDTGSVKFLNQEISREELVLDDRVKRVLYDSAREIQFKDIAFVLMLDAGQNDYAASDIPEEVQAVADQVLASFSMPDLEPLPDILSNEGMGRLAYIKDGDLWLKPLPDGEAIQMTTDGANYNPLWSPSGRWLAYQHGEGQVRLIRADGSAAHSLEVGLVIAYAWSPTADRLAFSLGGERQGELWVINADGTGLVSLVPQEAAGNGGLSQIGDFLWHPLGGQLLYYRWSEEPYPTYLESALWEVNAFTGDDRRELLRNNSEKTDDIRLAGWLAGGKSLLLWLSASDSASLISDGVPLSAWPYHLLPFDGNPLSEWPYPLLPDEGDFQRVTDMLPYSDYLSADPTNTGRLAAIDGVGRETWAGKSLFLWDYTTGHGRSLTGNDQAAAFPAFSANGMRLAYITMPAQETGRVT